MSNGAESRAHPASLEEPALEECLPSVVLVGLKAPLECDGFEHFSELAPHAIPELHTAGVHCFAPSFQLSVECLKTLLLLAQLHEGDTL